MKKRSIIITISVAAICLCTVLFLFTGRRPFKDLTSADIASAQIHLIPPDQTITVTDTDKLVSYLNELVIYHRDDSYREYEGQAVIVTLETTDGKQIKVVENNLFIIINGVGYKTKYEPCEELSNYANSLLY